MLKGYGPCHQATSSEETVALFRRSIDEKQPYDVVFMEVTQQNAERHNTLQALRQIEQEYGIKVVDRVKCIMISNETRQNIKNIIEGYQSQWDGYLGKPISPEMLEKELGRLELTSSQFEIFNRRQLVSLMIDVGDKAIIRELVIKFMAELPAKLLDMQKKLLDGKYNYIKDMAHKLVSLSGTYGFNRLSGILRSVEQGAAHGEENIVTEGLILAVKQWQELQEQLRSLLTDCEVHDGK